MDAEYTWGRPKVYLSTIEQARLEVLRGEVGHRQDLPAECPVVWSWSHATCDICASQATMILHIVEFLIIWGTLAGIGATCLGQTLRRLSKVPGPPAQVDTKGINRCPYGTFRILRR